MAAARAETQKQRRTLQAALDAAAKSRDAFSKELAAAQSAAQTLAEQAGDTASRPDPAAQQQTLTALQAERKNLRDQNQAALHRLDTNRDALTNLKKAITAAESARANAAMLDNLSKTINGNLTQKQKLPFEQYVQSFYFDGVVAAANRRFTRMTGGQYTLRRRQSADIAAKTALELDVFDAYTGKTAHCISLPKDPYMHRINCHLRNQGIIIKPSYNICLFHGRKFGTDNFSLLPSNGTQLLLSYLKYITKKCIILLHVFTAYGFHFEILFVIHVFFPFCLMPAASITFNTHKSHPSVEGWDFILHI